MTRLAIFALLTIGCGDDARRTIGDAGRADGGARSDGGTGSDAGPRSDGAAPDSAVPADAAGGVACAGSICAPGQLCCQVDCDGRLGCSAPEKGDCPLLGCPPPPRMTPCGTTSCDRDTQICVEGNFGGPTRIECRPVPAGCESRRTCDCVAATYCTTGLAMCSNVDENHVFCETGFD
jgi:hypothetical protein